MIELRAIPNIFNYFSFCNLFMKLILLPSIEHWQMYFKNISLVLYIFVFSYYIFTIIRFKDSFLMVPGAEPNLFLQKSLK